MITLDRKTGRMRLGSNIALSLALLSSAALVATAIAEPAQAQRKKRGDDKEEAPAKDYTPEFIEAYTAANAMITAEIPNPDGAAAAIPGFLAQAKTGDDKIAAGGLIFNIGQTLKNLSLQRQGFDLMIESGKVPADNYAQYLVNSGDLARQEGDMDFARQRFMEAHAAGYTKDDLPSIIAGTFFDEDRYAEGVSYLRGIIDAQIAAGQKPKSLWIDVAFGVAYNNDLAREAITLAAIAVKYEPNERNWRNAISVQRNLIDMKNDVQLDLLRLADRTDTMGEGRDYADYIEAANPVRLPAEVDRLLKEALAKNLLESDDPFVVDAREQVNENLAADRAELPNHRRDATQPNATAIIATAAGNVFLGHGDAASAEEMYAIALTKAGANANLINTRMGIAQIDQGKFETAQETFGKVGGERSAIAALWLAYATNQAPPAVPAIEPAAAPIAETTT